MTSLIKLILKALQALPALAMLTIAVWLIIIMVGGALLSGCSLRYEIEPVQLPGPGPKPEPVMKEGPIVVPVFEFYVVENIEK